MEGKLRFTHGMESEKGGFIAGVGTRFAITCIVVARYSGSCLDVTFCNRSPSEKSERRCGGIFGCDKTSRFRVLQAYARCT